MSRLWRTPAGSEPSDEQTLIYTQKRINTVQPIIQRVRKIYDHGISIAVGLIIGFDSDKPHTDDPLYPGKRHLAFDGRPADRTVQYTAERDDCIRSLSLLACST